MRDDEKILQPRYDPPKIENIEQAEIILRNLRDGQLEIEAALSLKTRHHRDGREFTRWEFRTWRERALIALMHRKKEIRYVEDWIKSWRKLSEGKSGRRTGKVARGVLNDIAEALDMFAEVKKAGLGDAEAKTTVLEKFAERFGVADPEPQEVADRVRKVGPAPEGAAGEEE